MDEVILKVSSILDNSVILCFKQTVCQNAKSLFPHLGETTMLFSVKDFFKQNETAELENHYNFVERLSDSLRDLFLQGGQSKAEQE